MSLPIPIAKSALIAAACVGFLAAPQLASAQPGGPGYGPDGYDNPGEGQSGTYYDPCARSQADRSVVGGLLGAVAGATLGNSVTHGGAKLGGAIIGGVAGAAAGASIGHATAACQSGQPVPYASGPPEDSDYGPPPPPPPPGAYAPNDDDRYAGPPPPPSDYRQPPQGRCQMVEDRVFFPDGTSQSSPVQACMDRRGRWHVVDDEAPGRD